MADPTFPTFSIDPEAGVVRIGEKTFRLIDEAFLPADGEFIVLPKTLSGEFAAMADAFLVKVEEQINPSEEEQPEMTEEPTE